MIFNFIQKNITRNMGFLIVLTVVIFTITVSYTIDSRYPHEQAPNSANYLTSVILVIGTILAVIIIGILHILKREKQKIDLIANARMRALRDAMTFQNLVMGNMPDIVFVKDENCRIISCNPAFRELYPPEDQEKIIGYTTVEKYSEAEAKEFLKNDREAFDKGFNEVEEKLDFPDGKTRTLLTKKVRFKNENNKRFILGISRDITDRKEAENEILRSNQELERFAYIASHDLQEPLRMVSNFTKLLREEYGEDMGDEARNYMKFILDASERMQSLINDLLDYSKVGEDISRSIEFKSKDKIKSALENLQESIRENNGIIQFEGEFPTLYLNPIRFIRLIQNLIGNAIKYRSTDINPKVIIKATEDSNNHIFSIQDNGIGIKKEYLNQVFVLFKRLHNKNEYSGTGIGLAVCAKIVDNFDGKIWAESQIGEGTTFYFTIPKTKGEKT